MPSRASVWNTKKVKYDSDLRYEDFVLKRENGMIIYADQPVSRGKGQTTSYNNILTREEGSDIYMARLEFLPGGGHEYHAHSGVEVLYMLDGKLKVTYRSEDDLDVTAECKAGDTAYFPPGTPHAVWNVTNDLCHFIVIKYGTVPYHYEEIPLPASVKDVRLNVKP